MYHPSNQHPLLRRAAIATLAVFLIACSAGLGYVAHLTREAGQRFELSSQPSVLPLAAFAVGVAMVGLVVLRVALHRDADPLAEATISR